MTKKHGAIAGLVIGAAVILTGCGAASPEPAPPDKIIQVPGSHVPRLELTQQAIQRLGIATQPVRALPTAVGKSSRGTGVREVIPYSAVIYDTDGSTWTYVNTAPRTYVRRPITITGIDGNVAVLSSGPPAGAAVVTVGGAELLGTEYNISGEE